MKTALKHTLVVLALFASTVVAEAQMKIGSNPTVTNPNANLEVEASTPNRKVTVDKTTGQVTIKDGTEGAGKVFTSDANGGGSWQSNTLAGGKIKSSVAQIFPNGVETTLILDAPLNITLAGNYLVSIRWWGVSTAFSSGMSSAYYILYKNGVRVDEIEYYVAGTNNFAFSFTLNMVASNCSVGDVLTIRLFPSHPTGAADWKTGTSGTNPVWMPSVLVSKI
ncbi:hypothetical protein ACS5NO_31965 [Larkinella sp. GY13]|uniref:hypothetical protein n=1 Tax=Larkinella sp. GY13 TaxID=3453720 RepID=UPI003EE84DE5